MITFLLHDVPPTPCGRAALSEWLRILLLLSLIFPSFFSKSCSPQFLELSHDRIPPGFRRVLGSADFSVPSAPSTNPFLEAARLFAFFGSDLHGLAVVAPPLLM